MRLARSKPRNERACVRSSCVFSRFYRILYFGYCDHLIFPACFAHHLVPLFYFSFNIIPAYSRIASSAHLHQEVYRLVLPLLYHHSCDMCALLALTRWSTRTTRATPGTRGRTRASAGWIWWTASWGTWATSPRNPTASPGRWGGFFGYNLIEGGNRVCIGCAKTKPCSCFNLEREWVLWVSPGIPVRVSGSPWESR